MKNRIIETLADFHEAVYDCRDVHVLFRGEDDVNQPLRPKFGRYLEKNVKNTHVSESTILAEFKRRSAPHIELVPSNEWEWLAVAQHFGLITRLLDWSENPLVAAHFAVHDPDLDRDRTIYAWPLKHPRWPDLASSPYSISQVVVYRPQHIAARIGAQSGVFTVHPRPEEAFDHPDLELWTIKHEVVWDLLTMIRMYGVNYASVTPDLDGVAQYINSKYIFGVIFE